MIKKSGNKTLERDQIAVARKLTPFEDIIHLAGICDINLGGRRNIGALILKKKEDIQVKFCFDCLGIHPNLANEQITPIFNGIEAGLKEIPEGESLTIHLGSFTNDKTRQSQLKILESNCQIEQIQLLLRSERLRVQELTKRGIRKGKFLRLWCTYTVCAEESEKSSDFVEKGIKKLENIWYRFTGEIHIHSNIRIENIIKSSFTDSFLNWESLIGNKMKLQTKALSSAEIWAVVWQQFNNSTPIDIPNPLTMSESGLEEIQNNDFHIRHAMLENEKSVPFMDRKWVRLQNEYIGVLNFSAKPGGWLNDFNQLRYIWDLIAKDKISDIDTVCQITKANQSLTKTTLQKLTKQSITSSAIYAKKGTIDVKAGMNIEDAVEAQRTVYSGSVVVNVALVFLVHRKTGELLNEACKYISSCFLRPAVVDRETEYAWKTWLQCCPLIWEPLLAKPFNRRLPYFSSEAPGLMPLICTATNDKSGFELIAEEGGTPIHIDLYKEHKNLAIFGATRSGKSVLVAGILTPAISQGIPVVALDYPKPDGTSTFTDYTNLLGKEGAYFDISKESNNLFEVPDLRGMDEEVIQERMGDFQEFLKSVLMLMIIGSNGLGISSLTITNVESLISLTLKRFFDDDDIKIRYNLALKNGIGTKEWNEIPTLVDFYNYCQPAFVKLDSVANDSEEVLNALNFIRLRLKSWLDSRIGKSISQPSSFRGDAKLLVFALRNLSSESDSSILAMSAYSAALRRALSSKASIFFLDEAPILFQFESIAELIGRLCANGAKAGIRVIVSAQEPESIFQSKSAAKIFANMSTRLVGRIQPAAVDAFILRFKYPAEIIRINSTFTPKKEEVYSSWLLDLDNRLTFCRFYPAYCLLASVANNPEEQELRNLFLNRYKNNLILGMVKFTEDYIKMLRGEEMSDEAKSLLNASK